MPETAAGIRYLWSLASVGIWVCAWSVEFSDSLTRGPRGESFWWRPDFSPFAWTPQQRLSLIPDSPPSLSGTCCFLFLPGLCWPQVFSDYSHSLVVTTTWRLPNIKLCFDFGLSSQLLIHGASCLRTTGISDWPCPHPNVVVSPSNLLLLLFLPPISGIVPETKPLVWVLSSTPSLFPASIPSPVQSQILLILYSQYQICPLFYPHHCLVWALVIF